MTNQSVPASNAAAHFTDIIAEHQPASKTTEPTQRNQQEADKMATLSSGRAVELNQLAVSELALTSSQPTISVINATNGSSSSSSSSSSSVPASQQQLPTISEQTRTTTTTTDQLAPQTNQQQGAAGNQWLVAANQTRQGIGQRMSQASDQLSHSIRQLYASASSITDVPPSYHNIPGIVPYYHGRSIGPPPSYDDVINPYAPPPTYQSLFGQMREARKTSRGLLDLLRRLLIILVSTLGCTILIAFMILIPFTMIIIGAIYIDECHIEHIPAFLLVGGLVWASKNIIHCYGQCKQQERQEDSANALADLYNNNNNNNNNNNSNHQTSSGRSSTSNMNETTVVVGATSQQSQRQPTEPPSPIETNQRGATIVSINGRRLKSSICESLLNCVLFGWFIAGCVIVFRNYEPDFENSSSVRYCHRTVYMYTFWLITSALISFGLFIGCICCLMVSSAVASRQDDIDLA